MKSNKIVSSVMSKPTAMSNLTKTTTTTTTKNSELARLGNMERGPIIAKSTIPGIGFGLFAEKNYKQYDLITIYGGKLYYESIDGEYVFRLRENPPLYVNGEVDFHPSEKGRWINHGYEQKNITANETMAPTYKLANTEFHLSTKKGFPICHIRALKNIKKGEELFVDYGPLYW
jgi:hypothetical protein